MYIQDIIFCSHTLTIVLYTYQGIGGVGGILPQAPPIYLPSSPK